MCNFECLCVHVCLCCICFFVFLSVMLVLLHFMRNKLNYTIISDVVKSSKSDSTGPEFESLGLDPSPSPQHRRPSSSPQTFGKSLSSV